MTKKDYELIAKVIKQSHDNISTLANGMLPKAKVEAQLAGVAFVALAMAAHLACDNPRFEAKRFFAACGFVEQPDGTLRSLEEVSKEAAANARAVRKGGKL